MSLSNFLLKIRPATLADLPTVMAIIGEAAAWLEAKGISQWPSPPNEHWWRRTAGHVADGEVYLAFRDGEAVGTLRLTWSDPYWDDEGTPAGYVHTMAIRNHVRGHGIGAKLLAWAIARIRDRGRRLVRLDCLASNSRLRHYYEEQGFVYRGQVTDRDYLAALYELTL